ncbi:MAG: Ig-like domain-containing protein, partial [Anaerolineae bacterium]
MRASLAAAVSLCLWIAYAPAVRAQGDVPPNLTIAFIGDQGLGGNARAVLELIQAQGADAVLHQGDLAYSSNTQAWDDQINQVLGPDFPYFASIGNHDKGSFYGGGGYQELLAARMNRLGVPWEGDLGVQSSHYYEGIFIVLVAPGVEGSGNGFHDLYIRDALAADDSVWRIASWHKNQREMQVGGKSSDTGWGVYEESRRGGAIIATAHEHSYSRTHLLSSVSSQTVASFDPTLRLSRDDPDTPEDEGRSFVFVSGLGGKSIRDQNRCLPSTPPYGCNGEWESIYTSDQGANYGALFGVFNYEGNPRLAYFYFMDIDGFVADEFFVESALGQVPVSNQPPVAADDGPYPVAEGGTLIVPAPGVLGNDGDPDGDALAAILVGDVASGALALGADGSFTYTHDGSPTSSDGFTYKATDGLEDSNVASVTISRAGGGPGDAVMYEETQTGEASNAATVTTAGSLTGVSGDLYLAAVSMKPYREVTDVSGLGLSWTEGRGQCAGRNQTGVAVWWALGVPTGDGPVTATLAGTPKNAVIAVSRYSGVDPAMPVGNVVSANTNGTEGACSGGSDNAAYSLTLDTTVDGAVVYGAAAPRHKTHTPGAGYTERAEIHYGSGGSVAGMAVEDRVVATASPVVVDGAFGGSVDWAVVGLEITPGTGGGGGANTPPQIDSGPTAAPNPVFADETAVLSVMASDADGDALTYSWAVAPGAGSISGTGPTVTYTPPAVTTQQVFAITVT